MKEEKLEQIELQREKKREVKEKRGICPNRLNKDMHKCSCSCCCCCKREIKVNSRKTEKEMVEEQKKKRETTLHRWTPDSVRLLDAYLSVGYGSNNGGVLQCAKQICKKVQSNKYSKENEHERTCSIRCTKKERHHFEDSQRHSEYQYMLVCVCVCVCFFLGIELVYV